MAGVSFAKTVSDCELMKDALEPHLTEMPHLASEHGELTAFLGEVKSLNARQKELTGELRQITRLRQEAELRGQDLRSRVASLIRGKLGFKNENLLAFGIPLRRKPRRKKTAEPPVEPAASEPATPAA